MTDYKQEISEATGIPAELLTGDTAEENIARAKALLAYRSEAEATRRKEPREQFAEWMNAQGIGEEAPDRSAALDVIAEQARVEAGGYPKIQDAGEVANMPDPRTAKEQFTEWIADRMSWNPRKRAGGWITIR